jgi:hypothetical protein
MNRFSQFFQNVKDKLTKKKPWTPKVEKFEMKPLPSMPKIFKRTHRLTARDIKRIRLDKLQLVNAPSKLVDSRIDHLRRKMASWKRRRLNRLTKNRTARKTTPLQPLEDL